MNEEPKKRKEYRPRRDFDETYKRHAVQLTLTSGRNVAEIARELDLSDSQLYAWRRQYAPSPTSVSAVKGEQSVAQKDEEIAQLRAEVHRLREREIVLKKSLGILSETPGSGMPRFTK
jgi:transposase